jgi:hypothetical protein
MKLALRIGAIFFWPQDVASLPGRGVNFGEDGANGFLVDFSAT